MTSNDKTKEIELLIDKAAKSEKSDDALHFSQAACNAANAVSCMVGTAEAIANTQK